MSSIADEIGQLNMELPTSTRLVAVSKFHPAEQIMAAYEAGQRIFGESRVQELCEKASTLPNDIEWHLIGHLQTNKVRLVVPFVSLIHSVDSLKLLLEINKEGEKIRRSVPCLLQIHIANEDTKFGFSPQECKQMLHSGIWRDLKYVQIRGLMGMATLTDNKAVILSEFRLLQHLFNGIRSKYGADLNRFNELSMGMSADYPLAVECGSTLVRIGSRIFGDRY
jgi:PLP dependent protein